MSDVRTEARRLMHEAEAAGLRLRLIGSLAVREHCPATEGVLDALGRAPAQDIDYAAPLSQERGISELFKRLQYVADPAVAYSREYGIQRLIYHHPSDPVKVDIFLDVLHMAHTIDFRNRLPVEGRTVDLSDLLLAKLQIHAITEKDLQDMVAILSVHGIGEAGPEVIDVRRLREVLSADWGFSFSASQNLHKLRVWLQQQDAIPARTREDTILRIDELTSAMSAWPTSLRWRLRAALGTRLRWYEEVEEVER